MDFPSKHTENNPEPIAKKTDYKILTLNSLYWISS